MSTEGDNDNDVGEGFEAIIDTQSGNVAMKPLPNGEPVVDTNDASRYTITDVHDDIISDEPAFHSHADLSNGDITTFTTELLNDGTAQDEVGVTTMETYHSNQHDFDEEFEYTIIEEDVEEGMYVHTFAPRSSPAVHGLEEFEHLTLNEVEDVLDHDGETRPPPSVLAQRVTHTRLGQRRSTAAAPKLNEPELMGQALGKYLHFMKNLKNENPTHSYLRVAHCFANKRSFGFCSALIRDTGTPVRVTGIIGVFWQTQSRPKRAVCVSFSRTTETEIITAVCTCSPLKRQTAEPSSGCYHANVCFQTETLMEALQEAFSPLDEVSLADQLENSLFGNYVDIAEHGPPSKFMALRLTRREASNRLGLQWMFVIVCDVECHLFTPVLRMRKRSNHCMLCKESAERRVMCNHEMACRKTTQNDGTDAVLDNPSDDEWDCPNDYEQQPRNTRTRYQESDEYFPLGYKRSILPCKGQDADMERLCHDLEMGVPIALDEGGVVRCDVCKTLNDGKRDETKKRRVRLYTLIHGAPDIDVYDWWCQTCQKLKRFTGIESGVFPGGASFCYTVELMYHWLHMVCVQSQPFRVAYKNTQILQNSKRMKFRVQLMNTRVLDGDINWSRRRANDAFWAFVRTIDTSSLSIRNNLFSCSTCEIPLTSEDCKELKIAESEKGDLKRLRAIVIDGTAAGILQNLPEFERVFTELPAIAGLASPDRLLKVSTHRKVVKKLLEMAIDAMRGSQKKPKRNGNRTAPNVITHNRPDGSMFWLTKHSDIVNDTHKGKEAMGRREAQTALMFCTSNSCACRDPYADNLAIRHSDECGDL